MSTLEPSREWLLNAATAEDNRVVSAGGFLVRLARVDEEERAAGRVALGKLVELRRREKGLSLEDVAAQTQATVEDLVRVEQGRPRVATRELIEAVSQALGLPLGQLLTLAGLNGNADPAVLDAAARFGLQASPNDKLSPSEHAALSSFLGALAAGG